MRCLWAILLLVPVAGAATWTDGTGDVQMTLGPSCVWQDMPPDWYPQLDVTEISFGEISATDLAWSVTLASLEPGSEPGPAAMGYYGVDFERLGQRFLFYIEHDTHKGTFTKWMYTPGGYQPYPGFHAEPELWGMEPLVPDGQTITARLGKYFLHSENWMPLRAGDVIHNVTPFARTSRESPCDTGLVGERQDALGEPQDIPITTGNARLGDVLLLSTNPSRGSNGAATTYLFDVEARNVGTLDDELTLQLQIPTDWVVRAPRSVTVPAGQTTPFQVAVTVPFVHQHGGYQEVGIRGISSAEPGKETELALRVWWTDPPHPGGHHPRIYIHEFGGRLVFLRTVPDDTGGTVRPGNFTEHGIGLMTDRTYHWRASLSPGLGIGLDFQPGTVQGVSAFEMPVDADVTATARVIVTGGEPMLVAQHTQQFTWSAGLHDVEWSMPIEDGIDRIPYDAKTNLQLEFDLRFARIAPPEGIRAIEDPPGMPVADAWFELPLVDYHDIIDDELASQVAQLSLAADQAEQRANPGDTVIFHYTAQNTGAAPISIDWQIDGAQAEWARLSTPSSTLAAGANGTVSLVVKVPESAQDGEAGSILVVGTDRGTGAQVFGKALVHVTTTEEIFDQAGQAPEPTMPGKESPLGLAAILALVCVALLGRRR